MANTAKIKQGLKFPCIQQVETTQMSTEIK